VSVDPVREWIELADQDEASACYLAGMRPMPLEVICFHCQQAAEKTLKAVLAKHGQEIPRTHDLLELLDLVLAVPLSIASLESRLLGLNDFAVVVRYPSHVPLEEQDVVQALEAVREVRKELAVLLYCPGFFPLVSPRD